MNNNVVSSPMIQKGSTPQKGGTQQECLSKYGKRAFFKDIEKRLPPMLYTFPGIHIHIK
jgi:hypothetical protein